MLQVSVARNPAVQRSKNDAERSAAAETSGGQQESCSSRTSGFNISFKGRLIKAPTLLAVSLKWFLSGLQEFSALKCGPLLSSGQVLLTECMNGLVELAGNPVTSPTLTSTIISLLAQLGTLSVYMWQCSILHFKVRVHY